MTSPEWEAANEDDSDRFPQTPHTSAPESTESHERGSRVVPDPARVARYAEALRNTDNATLVETNFGQLSATYDDAARAVVAVADEERAALVAEVERTTTAAEAAIEAANFRRWAAEAKVAKVEALADELTTEADTLDDGEQWDCPEVGACEVCLKHEAALRIRAALADAPAEQRAEHLAPPLRPDPDLIDNIEGDTKAVERTRARARDILAEGDGRG